MRCWTKALDKHLTPPGHPSEFPELVSTVFHWIEVIDEYFIWDVLKELHTICPPQTNTR